MNKSKTRRQLGQTKGYKKSNRTKLEIITIWHSFGIFNGNKSSPAAVRSAVHISSSSSRSEAREQSTCSYKQLFQIALIAAPYLRPFSGYKVNLKASAEHHRLDTLQVQHRIEHKPSSFMEFSLSFFRQINRGPLFFNNTEIHARSHSWASYKNYSFAGVGGLDDLAQGHMDMKNSGPDQCVCVCVSY